MKAIFRCEVDSRALPVEAWKGVEPRNLANALPRRRFKTCAMCQRQFPIVSPPATKTLARRRWKLYRSILDEQDAVFGRAVSVFVLKHMHVVPRI